MNVADLTQLIGSLGFPIVCCGVLFWQNMKTQEMHDEEMKKMTEAVNNNTLALTALSVQMGGGIGGKDQ